MTFLKTNPWFGVGLALVTVFIVYQLSGATLHLQVGKHFYLSGFSGFMDRLEADYPDYADDQWKAANKDFRDFCGVRYRRYSPHLNEEELHLVNTLKGRYRAIQVKYLTKQAKEGIQDLKEQLEGFWEEIQSGT